MPPTAENIMANAIAAKTIVINAVKTISTPYQPRVAIRYQGTDKYHVKKTEVSKSKHGVHRRVRASKLAHIARHVADP